MIDASPRLVSLLVVVAVAAFLLAVGRRGRPAPADDTLAMLSMIELRVEERAGPRIVRIPIPALIGRAPAARLVLPDAQVSRLHARIDVEDGELCIRDLGSRNGTWVNARPIEGPCRLRPGDEIEVGTTQLRYRGLVPA